MRKTYLLSGLMGNAEELHLIQKHERQARCSRGGGAGRRRFPRARREEEPERVEPGVRVADARRAGEDEVRVRRVHHGLHAHLGQLLQGE